MLLHWAIPEKSKHGGLRIYVFGNPLEFFIFLLYPWKFQTKQSSAHGYSTKLCQIPWKFQGQKQRSLEIPHYFFLVILGNSTSFLIMLCLADQYQQKFYNWLLLFLLKKCKLPVQTKTLLLVAGIFLVVFLFPCDIVVICLCSTYQVMMV